MKTIEINTYKFNELSIDAKQRVIERQIERNINCLDFTNEFLIEDFTYRLNELGYQEINLQWSCGYSQGDGLSFSFEYLDSSKIENLIKKYTGKDSNLFIDTFSNLIQCLYGTGNLGHYCYAKENQIKYEFSDEIYKREYENINKVLYTIIEDIQNEYMFLCSKFESHVYEAYEHETSEEKSIEDILENNEDFLIDGTII